MNLDRDRLDAWLTRENPAENEPVEVDPSDHLIEFEWEGEPPEVGPAYGEGECKCALCGATIGYALTSRENTYGAEIESLAWIECWRLPDDREVCADCADPEEVEA